jgi:DNA-binding transcriptional MerR regulator
MTTHPSAAAANALADAIATRIQVIRGQRVLLDDDLAELYGVSTRTVNQAVARNPDRFPPDFAFVLSGKEVAILRSQTVISRWGGRRYLPAAFTEQGVAMLSSVLRSLRAAQVNVAIMRAFVRLRQLLVDHRELAERVAELEQKFEQHDERIAAVFDAIRQLLQPTPPTSPAERIGFHDRSAVPPDP